METKKCSVCKLDLSLDKFGNNKTKKDGLQTHCIECGKQRNREWYARNKKAKTKKSTKQRRQRIDERLELLWSEAEKIGCHFCHENDRVVLDFHHLRDKEFLISKGIWIGYSWDRIKEEISKCVIVCSNCHRRVHAGQLTVSNPQVLQLD